jgi:hypothetical protein
MKFNDKVLVLDIHVYSMNPSLFSIGVKFYNLGLVKVWLFILVDLYSEVEPIYVQTQSLYAGNVMVIETRILKTSLWLDIVTMKLFNFIWKK